MYEDVGYMQVSNVFLKESLSWLYPEEISDVFWARTLKFSNYWFDKLLKHSDLFSLWGDRSNSILESIGEKILRRLST